MKLKSKKIRSFEELNKIDKTFPGVVGRSLLSMGWRPKKRKKS